MQIEEAIQLSLTITSSNEPTITVDNLEVAQFIYLLLNNKNIRSVIDTITYKVVLILGRFTPERKAVLDALRDALRAKDYLPCLRIQFGGWPQRVAKTLAGKTICERNLSQSAKGVFNEVGKSYRYRPIHE